MNVVSLLIFVVVIGLVLYIVNTVVPLPIWFKTVVNVLLALMICVWLLQLIGFTGSIPLHLK